MNNVGMANMPMVPGPPGGGPAMPMMNNGAVPPPVGPRPQQPINEANKHLLNTYIYEYFLRNEMFDCARVLLHSDNQIKTQDGPGGRRDENGNIIANGGDSMDVDNKDNIDTKGPEGLPQPSIPNPSMDNPFLYEWFCLFWDMFNAQKGKSGNVQVNSYMNHTQTQSRLRQNQQQEMLRQMRPDMTPQQQQLQMMRMQQNGGMNMAMKQPNNMAQRAMANSQNNPQMMHMLQQQQKQGQMQRDPSDIDGNRARPSSPGSGENAPSPSNKRIRLNEAAPFNPAQGGMVPNGRPAGQGAPVQQVGNDQTVQLLLQNGVDPASLNREQFAAFQNQSPAVQQKTIQTYAANLQQQQQQQMPKPGMPNANGPAGQGSPMVPQGPDGATINNFYNAADGMGGPGGIRPAGGPNANQQAGGSNHALQDYQMQLMLLEQQNKKRLMMARQEQDGGTNGIHSGGPGAPGGPGGPGAPPGAAAPFQGTSPQGARPGASPNPNEMKRPQQMNPAGMGSPMAEGAQSRGSPNAAMFMGNQMDPNQVPAFNAMAAGGNMAGGPHMNGLRPPSSHPQPPFNGPMNPQQQQQMMAARQQGQMAGQPGQQMQWQQQQGAPGGPNGNQMGPQGQTPQQVQGTPQQRNAMPPPAQPAVAAAASANARNTSSPQVSNAAPPTPSQTNKSAPKKKETKSQKDKRTAAQKKSNSNLNAAGATPVAEPPAENDAATPATPITPANPQQTLNRPGQNAGPNQGMPNGQVPAPVPQPTAASMVPPPDPNQSQAFNMDNIGDFGNLDFANPLATSDVLNDFDFDSFLHDNEGGDGGFDFSSTGAFMDTDGIET